MYFILAIILPFTFGIELPMVHYDGFQVFRIVPENDQQLQSLKDLQAQDEKEKYTFWNDATYVNQAVDVMVPPMLVNNFKNSLILSNLTCKVIIKNVQTVINKIIFGDKDDKADFNWKRYHNLEEIYLWLASLAERYPKIVTLIRGGTTYEGRNITGIKISFQKSGKAVFIEGGIRACERISPATATYIINEFLTSRDPDVRSTAESRTWYIFPITNPDGYEYTKRDALWRKNRNPKTSQCIGVDLNRNWGYKWMHGGGSDNPCSSSYAGNRPFSEIETRTLSEFIDTIAHTLEGYISLHSYGQKLTIPFGHNGNEVPRNNDEQLRIGKIAVAALAKRYGTEYEVGNVPQVDSIASGTSTDWVMHTHKSIKFTYTYLLRDQGKHGYLLPPDQIVPTGKETLDSIVSIIREIRKGENEIDDC